MVSREDARRDDEEAMDARRKPKEKRRSNEKRKEKSRDAARCRRSRETDIFTELAAALPVPPDQAAHLDKASIMRLAIAYLKVRTVVSAAIPEPLAKSEPNAEIDELFPKALDGFVLVLSGIGDVVYLSDNVQEYLGISQMDMMGQSVYEYSHPCDHDELRDYLSTKLPEDGEKKPCSFFLRLKCTLTSKGRKVNLKSASYKVIHCVGHLMALQGAYSSEEEPEDREDGYERDSGACLVLVGCPIPHPSNIEVPLGRHTFLSKHSLSMKFTYADDKLAEFLGWESNELVGRSVFEFYHALDNLALDKSFKSLFSKGQCETVAYRFLGKKGGYAWVVTQATLIHCSKQHKPLSVVCVNYILSGVEREDEVYSSCQLEARSCPGSPKEPTVLATNLNGCSLPELLPTEPSLLPPIEAQPPEVGDPLILEQAATASLLFGQEEVQEEVPELAEEAFPGPVPVTREIFCRTEASKKPEEERQTRDRLEELAEAAPKRAKDFLFQGKPVLEYDPAVHRSRPQAVTRSLFVPTPIQEQPSRPPPQTATATIFAPRTEDMNKGFLTFSEDQPGLTMLKDEPEDLTHLAPTAGDVCVPLEDPPFLSDMLDEFMLGNENYCPLLSPGLSTELRTSDLGESLKDSDPGDCADCGNVPGDRLGGTVADGDPFIYRDSCSPCSLSPDLLSLALSKSPERSVDSLCSPNDSGEGLSEDEMLYLSIGDVMADDELALRAPYIPMSDQDETLQLLISDDMVMWGPSQPEDKRSKCFRDHPSKGTRGTDSSLAQLLRSDSETRKYNDHGGGLVDPAQVLDQVYRKSPGERSWPEKKADQPRGGDRSNKRVHAASTNPENENKRIRCEEVAARRSPKDPGTPCQEEQQTESLSLPRGSQLLQQLMSQQVPKSRSRLGPKDDEGGGEGGGGLEDGPPPAKASTAQPTSPSPSQQSSSVLMNLLVSGCDNVVPDPHIRLASSWRSPLSPLSVALEESRGQPRGQPRGQSRGQSRDPPTWPGDVSLDHLSPDTRKQLVNSLATNRKLFLKAESRTLDSTTLSFDNFEFDVGPFNPGLLETADLLRPLDRSLV
ncbi:hypoxia-inducible factor 1-alpha isoform X2 [Orussus abietinus]|uniref:hypoxia-inducible factor 1-alpha isoform X2 n=1 Tax=Orussus abietinus TaxID=222816 RepID=UPI000626CE8D|nr:hypoxia-inducible factor 1-alpha isoform X2 [Orussus abietinus]